MRHALVFGVQTTGRVSATANDVRLPPLSGPCTVLLPSFIADRWRIHLHLSPPRCVLRAWRKKKKKKKKKTTVKSRRAPGFTALKLDSIGVCVSFAPPPRK